MVRPLKLMDGLGLVVVPGNSLETINRHLLGTERPRDFCNNDVPSGLYYKFYDVIITIITTLASYSAVIEKF